MTCNCEQCACDKCTCKCTSDDDKVSCHSQEIDTCCGGCDCDKDSCKCDSDCFEDTDTSDTQGNEISSEENSSGEEDDDEMDDDKTSILRGKWIYDGSTSIDEMIEALQREIYLLGDLKEDGWVLQEPVIDDHAILVKEDN